MAGKAKITKKKTTVAKKSAKEKKRSSSSSDGSKKKKAKRAVESDPETETEPDSDEEVEESDEEAETTSNHQTNRGKKGKSPYSDKIQACVQAKLWRGVKFIGSAGTREQATKRVFDLLGLKGKDNKTNWVNTYGAEVNKKVNAQRSYAMDRIKEALQWYWKKHDTIPTLDRFKACMYRTLDPKIPADLALFTFWVDRILAGASGDSNDWRPDVRCYTTISEAG